MSEGGSKTAVWLVVAAVIGGGFLLSQCDGSSDSYDASSSSGTYSGTSFSSDPPVLTRTEAQALSDRLAAAYEAQQICYGWRFDDAETGSNFGPGSPVSDHRDCSKSVELVVDYSYDSVEEEFTSVTYDIQPTGGVTLGKSDLTNAGIDADELLDEPNVAVSNAVGLLPVLVAEKGQAPAVPVPEGQQNTGGNTVERTFDVQWLWLVLAIILLGGGLVWVIVGLIRGRRKSREEQEELEELLGQPPQQPESPPRPQQTQQPPQGNDQGTDQGMGSQ
ncbi:hypothetical protein [Flindersiella endophytica]